MSIIHLSWDNLKRFRRRTRASFVPGWMRGAWEARMSQAAVSGAAARKAPERTIGFWMAAPMAILQGVNAVRVAVDPAGFAAYMGAPLAAGGDHSWVLIYGLRTAFIAALVLIFLVRRDLNALKWSALAALLMPFGDALIAHQAGAEMLTIARHLAIGAYLALTAIALFAGARGQRP